MTAILVIHYVKVMKTIISTKQKLKPMVQDTLQKKYIFVNLLF